MYTLRPSRQVNHAISPTCGHDAHWQPNTHARGCLGQHSCSVVAYAVLVHATPPHPLLPMSRCRPKCTAVSCMGTARSTGWAQWQSHQHSAEGSGCWCTACQVRPTAFLCPILNIQARVVSAPTKATSTTATGLLTPYLDQNFCLCLHPSLCQHQQHQRVIRAMSP